jgi:hypothetical protein
LQNILRLRRAAPSINAAHSRASGIRPAELSAKELTSTQVASLNQAVRGIVIVNK